MNVGGFLKGALDRASATGKAAAQAMSQSMDAASQAIADYGQRAVEAGRSAAVWTGEQAERAAEAAHSAAVWTGQQAERAAEAAQAAAHTVAVEGRAVKTVAGYTGAAVAGVAAVGVYKAGQLVTDAAMKSPAGQAYSALHELFRREPEHCLRCENNLTFDQRAKRIENRNALIGASGTSGDPKVREAGQRLSKDMDAVDLARLSADAYNEAPNPPAGWSVASPASVRITDPEEQAKFNARLKQAKARLYTLDASFPGGPKTVVAFRGTASDAVRPANPSTNDIVTDVDQAMGTSTVQYNAAMQIGAILRRTAPGTLVTGHSLGGGKAQAAGIAGGLKGTMFNAPGINPRILPGAGKNLDLARMGKEQFQQYRSKGTALSPGGDPLTLLSNSPVLQHLIESGIAPIENISDSTYVRQAVDGALRDAAGGDPVANELIDRIFSEDGGKTLFDNLRANKKAFGSYLPPTLGPMEEVVPKTDAGDNVGASPVAQHSMTNLINGIEERKYEDIKTMRNAFANPLPMSDYIATPGP